MKKSKNSSLKTSKANQRNETEKQQPHHAHSISETNQQ